MSAAKNEVQIALRLPPELLERVDVLTKHVDGLPEFALAAPSRSAVLRLALLRGVAQLEHEAKRRK